MKWKLNKLHKSGRSHYMGSVILAGIICAALKLMIVSMLKLQIIVGLPGNVGR
jgi:hypothetical protein